VETAEGPQPALKETGSRSERLTIMSDTASSTERAERRPEIVIVGAGFAGLACAAGLGNADVSVTVVDRRNHNLFQPLLYQVATAALSPADIAEPVRRTLGRFGNIRVMMGEVTGIDTATRKVMLLDGEALTYDYLVIATGSEYNYFGNDAWKPFAPGLKTIHEARLIRHRLLSAFERAERETDSAARRRLLTFTIIGGGPTGVEMAGAISELARYMIRRDFKTIDQDDFQVLLIEAGPKILAAFPDKLASFAHDYLTKIGVRVMTNRRVTALDHQSVTLGDERIETSCIVWGAGVKASPAAAWLGVEAGSQGRLPVEPDLSVRGCPNVYAIGDTALALDEKAGALPALAQVAKQQGEYLARLLKRRLGGFDDTAPFRFHNRGNTAVIGRNAAIFDFGKWTLKGRLAWFLWALVHVYLLINFEKRLLVSIQWVSRYFTKQRGARLIDEDGPFTR
jgi:NADH dehydrogenase